MINEEYFYDFPVFETARLILRKIELEDAADIQAIRSDQKVMTYMDSYEHKTLEDSEKFISEGLQRYDSQKGLFWGLVEKSSKEFIGDFSFWRIDRKNSRAEIGYTLKPQYWGKGYMKEAMLRLITFGFDDLNLHSLEANINPGNENSRNILLKLGFKKEGYFRENYFYNGKYLDSEIYSLLKKDFIEQGSF
ncbi:GNAT family N-acetyltransferase [Salinimicrobium soli]|uniref:GNAT family N-acetyltransferase n=1 Tax=Salinimicrobium soli TaxID=1254399 RepID=UPI003AAE46BB